MKVKKSKIRRQGKTFFLSKRTKIKIKSFKMKEENIRHVLQ